MRGARGLIAAVLAIFAVAQGVNAAENPPPDDRKACEGAAVPAARITACTAVLARPDLAHDAAGDAYFSRAMAERDLAQNEAALADLSAALEADPGLWPAQWAEAELSAEQRSYDQALADVTALLARFPRLGSLFDRRGLLYDWLGRPTLAAADYTRAMELAGRKDRKGLLHLDRALAEEGGAQWEKALADFAVALDEGGDLARTFAGMGRVKFMLGRYADAAADLERSLDRDGSDHYGVLWLYLAELRAKGDAAAVLQRRAAALDQKVWPWPIVKALMDGRDEVPVDPVPTIPPHWSEAARRAGAQCEVAFYMGEAHLARGDAATARRLFTASRAENIQEYIEYRAAGVELARMEH
jgi:lipoprotein NlpI